MVNDVCDGEQVHPHLMTGGVASHLDYSQGILKRFIYLSLEKLDLQRQGAIERKICPLVIPQVAATAGAELI